jgi:hypothetical protein
MQITWRIPLSFIDIAFTSTVLRWERICVGSCGYCIPDGCFPQWKLGVCKRLFKTRVKCLLGARTTGFLYFYSGISSRMDLSTPKESQ